MPRVEFKPVKSDEGSCIGHYSECTTTALAMCQLYLKCARLYNLQRQAALAEVNERYPPMPKEREA